MRKCVNLEDQPGFEQIYSPVLQQAIDRGIEGHSGTGIIDWGYVTPDLTTKPTIKPGKGKPVPDKFPPEHYNVVNAVRLGKGEYWDYLFNTYATPAMRALVLKYPVPGIEIENSGGYFSAYEGQYGTVYTPKGSTTDITTFFHEYGHYLDNVMGFELQGINSSRDSDNIMTASRLFLSEMIADGKAMGMILDDTPYWKYIFDNGLDVRMTNRGRRIKVNKGADEFQVSEQMRTGDFWRVMDEILILSKNDIQRIKNTTNPDPVKLKRAQEVHANLTDLYKQHLNRIKIARKITKQVMDGKLGQSPMFEREADAGLWRHPGAIGDILDALSGGAIYDYEQATGDSFMMGGHSSRGGYYSVRLYEERRGRWVQRNWNLSVAEDFKRYEIFAQLTQFMAHQDNTAWEFMSKLMPNLTKSYESIIKNAGGHPKKNTAN